MSPRARNHGTPAKMSLDAPHRIVQAMPTIFSHHAVRTVAVAAYNLLLEAFIFNTDLRSLPQHWLEHRLVKDGCEFAMTERKTTAAIAKQETPDLPSLIERLFDDVTKLIDQK